MKFAGVVLVLMSLVITSVTQTQPAEATLRSGRVRILPLQLDSPAFTFQSADGKRETCKAVSSSELSCSKPDEFVPSLIGAIARQGNKRYLIACVDGDGSCLRPRYGFVTIAVEDRTVQALEWSVITTDRKTGRKLDNAPAFFTVLAALDSPIPSESVETPNGSLTGVWGGTIHNDTAQLWSGFEITVIEAAASELSGCMAVHRPLYGSGELIGKIESHRNDNSAQLSFDVTNATGVIKFTGERKGDRIRGTYSVPQSNGHIERGHFDLKRQKETAALSGDRCPDDSVIN